VPGYAGIAAVIGVLLGLALSMALRTVKPPAPA
jgi:hypothetical protein